MVTQLENEEMRFKLGRYILEALLEDGNFIKLAVMPKAIGDSQTITSVLLTQSADFSLVQSLVGPTVLPMISKPLA